MPARRFFAMMEAGREMKAQEQAADYVAKCDIAAIAIGDVKYYNEVRKVFRDRAFGASPEAKRPALDPTDPKTIKMLQDITLQASRLN